MTIRRQTLERAAQRTLARAAPSRLARSLGLSDASLSRVRLPESPEADAGDALPLVLTHEPSAQLLQGDAPVEHLLPGSSEAYRRRRVELIDSYYEVVRSS